MENSQLHSDIYHKDLECQIKNQKLLLNDIGTEELAHLEMVGTIVHQLTDGASIRRNRKSWT